MAKSQQHSLADKKTEMYAYKDVNMLTDIILLWKLLYIWFEATYEKWITYEYSPHLLQKDEYVRRDTCKHRYSTN